MVSLKRASAVLVPVTVSPPAGPVVDGVIPAGDAHEHDGVDLGDVVAVGRYIRWQLARRGFGNASVSRGRGTSSGWITIACRASHDGPEDRRRLGELLSTGASGSHGVPSSMAHRREWMDRAAGRPFKVAEPYWD